MRTISILLAVVTNLLLGGQSHGQTVNGHPATVTEAAVLASHGITAGNWRMDGWGIASADRSPVTKVAAPRCHFVLDVPLDCNVVVASN